MTTPKAYSALDGLPIHAKIGLLGLSLTPLCSEGLYRDYLRVC